MSKKIIVGLVQYSPVWENKLSNQQKIKKLIEQTGKPDLIIFPEMTLTGFTMKSDEFCEELNGESYLFFSELAKNKKSAIMYGVIEKGKNKNFNTLVHLNNQGKVIKTYRKIHPFSYAKEDKSYGKGKDTVISRVQGFNIGLSICYDLRFPELYRFYGKEKADIIIDIANWPDTRIDHWRTLLKARAI
ncbi:MAG: nitrilase-related carbon-nitrogen hydrolase, partial [Ignavibacteriaceae bacterium]|nr:nitrilase-related carbon-nitrogen hydrolase [Ignavibacteriaceae bacterium]